MRQIESNGLAMHRVQNWRITHAVFQKPGARETATEGQLDGWEAWLCPETTRVMAAMLFVVLQSDLAKWEVRVVVSVGAMRDWSGCERYANSAGSVVDGKVCSSGLAPR